MSERRVFRFGLDVGQRIDHSAVCLAEELEGSKAIVRLLIKYPLGTGYPLLIETVTDLYRGVSKQGDVWSFAVDATGVGAAPSQMLQEALPEVRIEPFIFSNKTKRELVGKVKVLHSFGRLKFATRKGDDTYNRTLRELIQEMKELQAKVIKEDASNPEIEIFKTGAHDDLFTALALAVKDVRFDAGTDLPTIGEIKDGTWITNPFEGAEPNIVFF